MLKLKQLIHHWPSGDFQRILKREIESLAPGSLPLHKGVSQGGMVDDSDISITVLNVHDTDTRIEAKLGVFFTEVVICCGCGDDPMPINAYCELLCTLDKKSAEMVFQVHKGNE